MCLLNLKIFKYFIPLLFSFLLSYTFAQDAESPVVAKIMTLSGKIWLSREGKKEVVKKGVELKKGDILEVEDRSGITIVYFEGGKQEECKPKSMIEIGADKSIVRQGVVIPVKATSGTIIMDKQNNRPFPHDKDIAHAGGQFIRGILPPKQYFEDAHIRRYAVVIGISHYKDPKIPDLKYADVDAQAFYDFITSPIGGNFTKENVLLLKNEQATLKNVKIAITDFLKKAVDTDFVVIFMACHGEPEPDRPNNLYLLMHDTELDSLPATAYHMENVNTDMKRYVSAKRLIFIADACHSAGITEGAISTRGLSNSINVAISSLKATREGWGIMSASRAGEISLESGQWGGGHGVFTHFLLEGLSGKADLEGNKNGIVTIAEAFDFVEEKVKRATRNAQHPDIAGNFDNNLPLGFPGVDTAVGEKESTTSAPRYGVLHVTTSPEGALIYVNGAETGKTPLNLKLISGTYPLSIQKTNYADIKDSIFINPDEKTDVYYNLAGSETREVTKPKEITSKGTQLEYIESANEQGDMQKTQEYKQRTKENIDSLIKELESMAKEQSKEGKPAIVQKPKEMKPDTAEAPRAIPVSIKEFKASMGALSNKREMERLRRLIIDALLNQSGISVVERDLEFQEELLREQRLGGSILADELYRIELGKIQGAAFLCFGGVSQADTSGNFILRMEIVNTATTLIDTLEHTFKSDDNLKSIASDVATKIREKITAKGKL
ncbi:MAG: caspase family protein [Candidatus Brocadiaceae bacterium]